MTTYAEDHATALADVQSAGAAVTFTRATPGEYDPAAGRWWDPTRNLFYFPENGDAPSAITFSGFAVQEKPDLDTYRALSLTLATAVTLFVVPSTYGTVLLPGDTVVWGGATVTAVSVAPLDPDGNGAIAATVVCQR